MSEFVVGVRVDGTAAGLASSLRRGLGNERIRRWGSCRWHRGRPAPRWKPRRPGQHGRRGAKDYRHRSCYQETETSLVNMATRTQREFARMAQARETLGIRSEHRIQQEILRTQAAYQRLASSGTMTWREQQRRRQTDAPNGGPAECRNGRLQRKAAPGRRRPKAGLMAAGVMAVRRWWRRRSIGVFPTTSSSPTANTAGDPSLGAEEDRKRRFAGRQEMDRTIREAIRYGGDRKAPLQR